MKEDKIGSNNVPRSNTNSKEAGMSVEIKGIMANCSMGIGIGIRIAI